MKAQTLWTAIICMGLISPCFAQTEQFPTVGLAMEAPNLCMILLAQAKSPSNLRTTGEAAWPAHDYAQVVEVYGPVCEDLTEVEAKKLAYAEQQVLAAEGVASRCSSRKQH